MWVRARTQLSMTETHEHGSVSLAPPGVTHRAMSAVQPSVNEQEQGASSASDASRGSRARTGEGNDSEVNGSPPSESASQNRESVVWRRRSSCSGSELAHYRNVLVLTVTAG